MMRMIARPLKDHNGAAEKKGFNIEKVCIKLAISVYAIISLFNGVDCRKARSRLHRQKLPNGNHRQVAYGDVVEELDGSVEGSAGLLHEGKGSTYEGGMRVPARLSHAYYLELF